MKKYEFTNYDKMTGNGFTNVCASKRASILPAGVNVIKSNTTKYGYTNDEKCSSYEFTKSFVRERERERDAN